MALYGVERWCDRGEAFSVYFNLFSRLSIFETRDREVGVAPPLVGARPARAAAGTVPLLVVMIGTVSFDGFSSKRAWNSSVARHLGVLPGRSGCRPSTRSS